MIVRLDFERAGPAVADVNDAGIFPRPLHDQLTARGQTPQVNARRLIRTVLAPHHAEDAEFGPRGFASAEQLLDFFEFFRSEAVLPDHLRRNGSNTHRRCCHRGIFIVASPQTFRMRIRPHEKAPASGFVSWASALKAQRRRQSCGPRSTVRPPIFARRPPLFANLARQDPPRPLRAASLRALGPPGRPTRSSPTPIQSLPGTRPLLPTQSEAALQDF